MPKQLNYQTGKSGEAIAADYLTKKDYRIISKNFHNRFGEIDLIVSDGKTLVFVEVKLKIGDQFGAPEEMINRYKINQVLMTAESFLQSNPQIALRYPQRRVDAVCITLSADKTIDKINHWTNISADL